MRLSRFEMFNRSLSVELPSSRPATAHSAPSQTLSGQFHY